MVPIQFFGPVSNHQKPFNHLNTRLVCYSDFYSSFKTMETIITKALVSVTLIQCSTQWLSVTINFCQKFENGKIISQIVGIGKNIDQNG